MATDSFNPGQEARTVTASPTFQAVQAKNDPNASANALAAALGSDSFQRNAANFQQVYDQNKLQEQSVKIEAYTQQFMQDHEAGAVSKAQLKERFPEMVPIIAARVAESIGKKQGALEVASAIEHINGNDSLRLDTAQRAAYVKKTRADLFARIPEGNDFYSAGMVSAMDRAFGEQELKWQGQTANYHQEVQKTALSGEVVAALNSVDPTTAMAKIDSAYGASSSLNNVERNKVYVDAVIKSAAVSDDPTILDRIPQAYLNIDSKAAINGARIQITNQQWSKFTRAKEFEAFQRDETERKGKLDILAKLSANEDVNPAQYMSSPGLHAFAVDAMSTPSLPEAKSKANVQAFRLSLLDAGHISSMGSQADIIKNVLAQKGMNPKEKAALVDEIPKLMEGAVLMNDPNIRRSYTDNIGFRLDDLAKSPAANISSLMGTGNLRGNATAMFEGEIRGGFEASYQETGRWPIGFDARKITDAAVAKVSAYIDRQTSIEGIKGASNTASGRTTPTASKAPTAAQPAAALTLPKGVTKLN